MEQYSMTIGVDLGDKKHRYCVVDAAGRLVKKSQVANTREGLRELFEPMAPARVVMEAGAQSAWVSEYVRSFGHEVLVANPRRLALITQAEVKTDWRDAEMLARIGRSDPSLLRPIRHRGRQAQLDLTMLRARDGLVRARSRLVNQVRSLVKVFGCRLPACSAESFHRKAPDEIPEELRPTLEPLLETIAEVTERIHGYDRDIEALCARYPETEVIGSVQGVGPLTALTFVLTIEDPHRFEKSREVAPYLGLTPRKSQSGDSDPQLRITKAGNRYLRGLLVGSAHYILGPFAQDSALRDWGLAIQARGGKNAKKRAVVAVARRLSVLLHRLWVTGEVWEPYPAATPSRKEAAA